MSTRTHHAQIEGGIRQRLARHLTEEAGLGWLHPATRSRMESEAGDLIDAWRRSPKAEPSTDAERMCQEVVDNDRALTQALAENAAARRQAMANHHPALVSDPDWTEIMVQDASTHHIYKIRVPSENVRMVIGRHDADGKDIRRVREA